jgi:N-methylhydantoinase B/oxoprolinase/acetone carboxylase alpha subunit
MVVKTNPSIAPDPITIEVVRHKLDGIANEMQSTLLRSSFSPIVKEGLDASACLFTADGETLAQAVAIPIHLGTMIPIVRSILDTYPLDQMHDGDIFILNDPYAGGTHLPDIALLMPVFHEGRPIAFSTSITHHQDVGGMTPGSVPTNATEIFQEGIRIPALRLRDRGMMNETLISMLKLNVRIPETFMGDLNAQIAACTVGARRLGELAARYGHNLVLSIFGELLDRSEMLTRQALMQIPNGTYSSVDWLDNDGIELDKRVRVEVSVTIKDGTMHCNFAGTAPQVKGPINCVPSGSLAGAYFAIRALTDPNIPSNGGCFRPVTMELPHASLVNPVEPAPVNARTPTIKRVTSCIISAFKGVLPEKVPADSAGETVTQAFGYRRNDGKTIVSGELLAGGSGASAHSDGVDVIDTDATNCMNLPVEALEMDLPLRVEQFGLAVDSGGPGFHRGGLGFVRKYVVLDDRIVFSHRGERYFTPTFGSHGGGSGAPAGGTITRANGRQETIPSKIETVLMKGDRLELITAGGAGYGNPRERDRSLVEADVENGKVSPIAAREIYALAQD